VVIGEDDVLRREGIVRLLTEAGSTAMKARLQELAHHGDGALD
jgi:hypothetical protein